MAYSEELADRIRTALAKTEFVSEKKMFGGLCFLLHGNMVCGVVADTLMLRLGEAGAAAALDEPHVAPMDFTGKPMKTMVYVGPAGIRTAPMLRKWLMRAVDFVSELPPKEKPPFV